MLRLPLVSALIPALFFVSGAVRSETFLMATLTNDQEVPPAQPTLTLTGELRPASFGEATFLLNDARTALTFAATIFNIDFGDQTPDTNDNLTNAHIHAGPFGGTGPVVWGFIGMPFNDTAPSNVLMSPFANGVGGTVTGTWDLTEGNGTTLTEQLDAILSGGTYINFHTNQFPGGEVRGQIVPEPSTFIMLSLAGLALVVGWRRRLGAFRPG
jgi:hypothetical protein